MNGAVFRLTEQSSGFTVTPGVPGSDGYRKPLLLAPNWLLLKLSSASVTGSIVIAWAGHPAVFGPSGSGAVAGVLKIAAKFPAERSSGKIGSAGLLISVPGESALR